MTKSAKVTKNDHELRDPIHVFIKFDSDERRVIDSRAMQRLRHIHQLALSYLVYPGATHKRFEHSLGVMDVAARIFDTVTKGHNISDEVKSLVPEINRNEKLMYWRRVLRMAALCHDIGHLPFSHAAEEQLLPEGWNHERLTRELILSSEMQTIWSQMTPPLRPDDIVKLAVGPRKARDLKFSRWETILSEIIVGDAFGADRIDYLLRDSHHAGVSYGRFDHHRLLDTMRILPTATGEPALGIESGGLQSAEALLIARYLIYSQVYLHPVRRIYDLHLCDFLSAWLPGGRFKTDVGAHLSVADNEVTAGLLSAAFDDTKPGHNPAQRIVCREHFKVLYEKNPDDSNRNPDPTLAVFSACKDEFGQDLVKRDKYVQKGGALDFPVLLRDGNSVSSLALSQILRAIPVVAIDCVFIAPEKRAEAEKWLEAHRATIIQKPTEIEDE